MAFLLHSASNYVDMTSKVILINKPTGVKREEFQCRF